MAIYVQSKQTTATTAFGRPLLFDFGTLPATEQIQAYIVGLSYFRFQYETNSSRSEEQVGRIRVSLVPFVRDGDKLAVNVNMVLTDFDGDTASNTESYAVVTAVAYTATGLTNQDVVMTTAYAVDNTAPSSITVSTSATPVHSFVGGFDVSTGTSNSSKIGSIAVTTSAGTPTSGAITPTGSVSLGGVSPASVGTVDVAILAVDLGTITDMAVQPATIPSAWTGPNGTSGLTNTATADFGSSVTVDSAVFLLDSFDVQLSNTTDKFAVVEVGITDAVTVTPKGSTVSVPLILNIYRESGDYVSSSSTLSGSFIAQIGPSSSSPDQETQP